MLEDLSRYFNVSQYNFINSETINIFTDASYRHEHCASFGAMVEQGGLLLAYDLRGADPSQFSNNVLELKAIELGIGLASIYGGNVPYVNIFSDSLYAVRAIKGLFKIKPGETIKNQEIIKEVVDQYYRFCTIRPNTNLNIFYTPAHINPKKQKQLNQAMHKFAVNNGMRSANSVDPGLMWYLCRMNNVIDNSVQKISRDPRNCITTVDPIKFC